jgi:hypothetical protein
LGFGVRKKKLWATGFAEEFRKRKGYDLIRELPALFADVGPRTPKVRLDYWDVVTALSEENYFRPIFEWHYRHGMLFGGDHGGRGLDATEFGDYFRTQRWMLGPGNDAPGMISHVAKNKVNSSITHLYQRPRTWLEGYYGSGWGTTPAALVDATFRNFVLGHNLLAVHGLYYTTYGGFWEWAPPCNFFRMPYWPHTGEFLAMSERLSYLLSQGAHRCDVAVLYPVAPMEARLGGYEAVKTGFAAGTELFEAGIDFDFMDFQSLARAEVRDKQLHISGEAYRVLVLPGMRAVRHSTMQKALDFFRAGGVVVAVDALPEAGDRVGRQDPELDAMVKELFGLSAAEARRQKGPYRQTNAAGGVGWFVPSGVWPDPAERVSKLVARSIPRDFRADRPAVVLHRKIGPRDVYMVFGAAKNSECFFRARGKVELWDPWTGKVRPLFGVAIEPDGTRVRMPLEACEAQLIVFNPGRPAIAVEATDLDEIEEAVERSGAAVVRGYSATGGRKTADVRLGDRLLRLEGEASEPTVVAIEGPWEFTLHPTLDNRWGDFRLPASNMRLGAEARRFRWAQESSPTADWRAVGVDDSAWATAACSFGPRFWRIGPLPGGAEADAVASGLAAQTHVDVRVPVRIGGKEYRWRPYEFSMRWGVEGDPGPQGYHGLKQRISDDFIALGRRTGGRTGPNGFNYQPEPEGKRYYLWTTAIAPRDIEVRALVGGLAPSAVWLGGRPVKDLTATLRVKAGANPLLLRYDGVGRGHFVLRLADAPPKPSKLPLSMTWLGDPAVLSCDVFPEVARPVGWYRFVSPPGLWRMTIAACGTIQVWIDGEELALGHQRQPAGGSRCYTATVPRPRPDAATVAIRVRQDRGCYGGAALPEPIALDCVAGRMSPGDWSKRGVLETYSGGAWYRRTVGLTPRQTQGRVVLDLGGVAATAEVRVNGRLAAIKVAPPWRVDISAYVRPGDNRFEILVYNTLANHYLTIPTNYGGSPTSGLLGPVRIESSSFVTLTDRIEGR